MIAVVLLACILVASTYAVLAGSAFVPKLGAAPARAPGQIPDVAGLIGKDRAGVERALRPFTVLAALRPVLKYDWSRSIGASASAAYTLADFSDNASQSPAAASARHGAQVRVYFGSDGRCINSTVDLSGTAVRERFRCARFSAIASDVVSAPVTVVAPPNLWQWVVVSRSKGKLLEGTFTRDGQPRVVFVTWGPSTPFDVKLAPGDPGNYSIDVYRMSDWLKYSKGLGPPTKAASDPSSQ